MCVIACKYIKGLGWVGVKNRDRNYKPTITVKQSFRSGVESIFIVDSVTKYSEGVNEYGLCIINSATSVKNDESEVAVARRYERSKSKKEGTYRAPDGIKVRRALKMKTPEEAVKYLSENKFMGHTLVFNENTCLLLEGGHNKEDFERNMAASELDPDREWDKMRYEHKITKVSKNDFIVRTNHGHFLPWTGYQKDSDDDAQIKSRESSEARHATVIKNLKHANTPEEMLNAISDISNSNSQLNPVRLGDYTNQKKLKTTGQLCMIPRRKELIYTPIWSDFDAKNFTKLNHQKTQTFFTLRAFNTIQEKRQIKSFVDFLKT
jgi:hypothetical protein